MGGASGYDTERRIGQNIRLRRIARGLSQADLAGAIGLTYQQVQKYEAGKNRISASRLYDVASALKCPAERFFDGLPDPGGGADDAPADFVPEDLTPQHWRYVRLLTALDKDTLRHVAALLRNLGAGAMRHR